MKLHKQMSVARERRIPIAYAWCFLLSEQDLSFDRHHFEYRYRRRFPRRSWKPESFAPEHRRLSSCPPLLNSSLRRWLETATWSAKVYRVDRSPSRLNRRLSRIATPFFDLADFGLGR